MDETRGGLRERARRCGPPLAVMLAAVAVGVIGPAAVLAPSPPVGTPRVLAQWAYDVRLWLGVPAKSGLSLMRALGDDVRAMRSPRDSVMELEPSEIDLMATLYAPEGAARAPGILLLHGSAPAGRRLGLYRVLGDHLCRRGYVVLAPDQRGYGDSGNPRRLDQAESFDYVGDARRALDDLGRRERVDESELYVLGHSFGADVALSAGLVAPNARKIVAFAPTRGMLERAGTKTAPQAGYHARREMRYMELAEPISWEVFAGYRLPLVLEAHLGTLSQPGHKPLLVIEGEREPSSQRAHFSTLRGQIAEPLAHVTLTGADHYANVADVGGVAIYSGRVMTELIDAIDGFLAPPTLRRAATCVQSVVAVS